MSEHIETTGPTNEPQATSTELTPLEKAHNEVLAKRKQDKTRIAELEAKVSESESKVKELTLTGPVRQMMSELSVAPESLLAELSKSYKFELVDGQITMLKLDGTPSGIPFKADDLKKMLLASQDETAKKLYGAILIGSKASGANFQPESTKGKSQPKYEFGFR